MRRLVRWTTLASELSLHAAQCVGTQSRNQPNHPCVSTSVATATVHVRNCSSLSVPENGTAAGVSLVLPRHDGGEHRPGAPAASPTKDSLLEHCELLRRLMSSPDGFDRKRRRVLGVVRKFEQNYMDWLTDPAHCTPEQISARHWTLLETLSACSHWLPRRDRDHATDGLATTEDEMSWAGCSPFFSPEFHDALCLCLQAAVRDSATDQRATLNLLEFAVQLELADGDSLQIMSRRLTSKLWCHDAPGAHLAQSLKWISLATKRCKIPLPPLDQLLCRLPTAELCQRDALEVLSALVRLRDVRAVEVSKVVQRKAVPHVPHYTTRDIVYALAAIAILDAADTGFAAATLRRCELLTPTMSPTEIGDVCKYVALMNPGRQRNEVSQTCSRELRRLLPALVERTEALLGQFRLRDARCVLRCFQQHRIRHSVVFSQLTPLAS